VVKKAEHTGLTRANTIRLCHSMHRCMFQFQEMAWNHKGGRSLNLKQLMAR